MRRLPSSLPFLAPAPGLSESATMSSPSSVRSIHIHRHTHAQFFSSHLRFSLLFQYRSGRHQWRREFSDRPYGGRDGTGHYVTGDSHLRSVRDANLGFRPQFQPQTPPFKSPPPRSRTGQSFRGPQQQLRPRFQPLPPRYQYPPHGQSFSGPPPPPSRNGNRFNPAPPFNRDETFRPRQQFQPRPQPPPDYRIWEFPKAGSPPGQFRILSYNLLAEYLATNHRGKLYFHIPRHVLDWDWRKRRIIFELGLWKADILCFQEVDRFQDLEEDLKPQGYSGIWKMRTGDPIDGCAIFWRVSRFKLLHEECIEYSKLGLRDNVAQICVFELMNQNDDKDLSDSLVRLQSSNKVVVCNIHVLYNPRRGEIKLGQVRVLLGRAHAVSKLWDDAPVVLCGDFNCTPKSPLYNYISEQKLDLSDLPRDKVSGQASAEIQPVRQFTANIRAPGSADDTGGSTKIPESGEFGQFGSPSKHEGKNTGASPSHAPSVHLSAPLTAGLKTGDSSSMTEHCGNKVVVSSNEIDARITNQEVECCDSETQSTLVYCESEAQSTSPISISHSEEPSSSQNGNNFVSNLKDGTGSFGIDSCEKDICPSLSGEHNNNAVGSCEDEASLISLRGSENLTFAHIVKNVDNSKLSSEVTVSPESSLNTRLSERMENLSLDGVDEPNEADADFTEDSSTFLSELHDGDRSISHGLDFEPVDEVKYSYDPSAWTPMEIETATGCSDWTVMEHALKLRSTYTEVQALSGTRDSGGEPIVTSYNRCFLGTVDYIWRSEGLQTVSVLAPIPKQAMQWTPGFPTKKWGSDHISLVSELAFTDKTLGTRNTEAS